jgi:hypothetical protein
MPPTVVGGAVVVPAGLIQRLRGERGTGNPAIMTRLRERIERLAVDEVLRIERALGREPTEMPHDNPGFDVKSKDPSDGRILFIEVKGRVEDATTVTVSKNEILTGLNEKENFRLAIGVVGPDDSTTVRYVTHPFKGDEDALFGVTSVNFNLAKLLALAEEPS